MINGEQVCQCNSSRVTVQARAGCDIEQVLRVRWKLWLSEDEKKAISDQNKINAFARKEDGSLEPIDKSAWEYFCQVFVSEEHGRVFGWVDANLVQSTNDAPKLEGLDRFEKIEVKPPCPAVVI